MLWVQDVCLVLGKVVEGRTVAHRAGAGIGREDARQHPEQGALARAVFADEGDALAALHCEVERPIDDVVTVRLGHALELQHVPAGGGRNGKPKPDALGIAGPFDPLDLLQLLEARLDLTGPGGLIPEPVHKLLHARNLLVLAVGSGLLRHVVGFAPGEVLRVVAGRFQDSMVPDLPDVRRDAVEKGGVVADDQHREGGLQEKVLEPALRLLVEMVRRLVK